MPAFWDPRSLLEVDPSESGFTCTAIVTPHKKKGQPQEGPRRCRQAMLSNECKEQACHALDALAWIDVVSEGVSDSMARALVRIAGLTSCPRWHKKPGHSQAEAVGAKWKDIVERFVADERVSRGLAERGYGRGGPAPVPNPVLRPEEGLFVRRDRVPSVPDLEVHEPRPVAERAPRSARENPPPPDVEVQYRPRHQQQPPPQQQPAPQMEAHSPQPYPEQPIQEPAPEVAQPNVDPYVNRAAPASRAGERRLAQQQAELRPDPNGEQPAIQDWAPRPSPALGSEIRHEPEIQDRQYEPRPHLRQAAEGYRPRPAAAVPRSIVPDFAADIQRLRGQIDRVGLDHAERMQAEHLRVERAEAELLARLPAIPAPAVRFIPIHNQAREPEDDATEEAVVSPAAEDPRARPAAADATPARHYVPKRKPPTECYICTEDFDDPDDTIWCQGQCGYNVHRECFEKWNRINVYALRKQPAEIIVPDTSAPMRNCGYDHVSSTILVHGSDQEVSDQRRLAAISLSRKYWRFLLFGVLDLLCFGSGYLLGFDLHVPVFGVEFQDLMRESGLWEGDAVCYALACLRD
ncbi:hypothetical protein BKA65DRAFT_483102 [Rhexocercosporidium sp. MPI-PUGE-AT-0058]|nr:hypothetical protein BKA65DRAFT_483102 [Rhexocercosporidium sp. MPI-PUGE-AT-0058]